MGIYENLGIIISEYQCMVGNVVCTCMHKSLMPLLVYRSRYLYTHAAKSLLAVKVYLFKTTCRGTAGLSPTLRVSNSGDLI